MKPSLRSASTRAKARQVSSCMTSVAIGVPSKSRWTAAGPVGSMRCADQPQPPASIASLSRRQSSACSAPVGRRPAFASSKPRTQMRSGPTGT